MAHPVQLSSSRDTPNPLRPYYRPPSIGLPPGDANATSASTGPSSSLGSSARHVFDDLDYSSFLNDGDSASVADMGRKILDQALWKYTSVLLAQPFDVAKTILQVRLATQLDAESTLRRRTSARFAVDQYPPSDDESDPDEPSYFTPTKPTRAAESDRSRSRRPRTPPSRESREQSPAPHVLQLRRPDSVMEALSQLWQQAGAAAMWKATNATFIYNVLLKAVEGWTRNMLSALLDLPDPSSLASVPAEVAAGAMGGLNLADSPSPLASLGIAVAASAIAGLLLAPLDLVRTRYASSILPIHSHADRFQTYSYTNHVTTACHSTKPPLPAESHNPYLSLPDHPPPLHTSDSVEYQYSPHPPSILQSRSSLNTSHLLSRHIPDLNYRALHQAPPRDYPSSRSDRSSQIFSQICLQQSRLELVPWNQIRQRPRNGHHRPRRSLQRCLRHRLEHHDRRRYSRATATEPYEHSC
jgi:hypothetical protein